MQKVLALFFLILSLPVWPFLYLAVKLTSPGHFIFKQKRVGKDKLPFTMYKVRTMVDNAEKIKHKYQKLNEADGPVFKIKNDPRFTKVGKLLARTAVDEIPQFINVLKGEMALVGPRPLPVNEAAKIPLKYQLRFSILPGMTSTWIIKGNHQLTFRQWMALDIEYVKCKSPLLDLRIFIQTILFITKPILK